MTDQLVQRANADPHYAGVFTLYRAHTPQLFVDIDRAKVQSLQVPIQDVFTTLQVYMGGYYVNQFNKFGRTWQVNIQADPESRTSADILKQLYVRSSPSQGQGQMVPLGTLLRAENSTGPLSVMRYNMYTSAAVNGIPAPGVSSGTVVQEMTRLARELDVPFEWTEMTFLQVQAGNVAFLIFGLGTVLVYLVLAAKYESWRLPLAVILVVPMCLLAAVTGMAIARLPVDIFVQIGFLVLVGLACKNAILIVEFAQRAAAAGRRAARGGAGGRPDPFPADHHDVAGVHRRRLSAGGGHRGRGGDAPVAGHGGVQRHDRRHPVRHLPDAGVLFRPHAVRQPQAGRHGAGLPACRIPRGCGRHIERSGRGGPAADRVAPQGGGQTLGEHTRLRPAETVATGRHEPMASRAASAAGCRPQAGR